MEVTLVELEATQAEAFALGSACKNYAAADAESNRALIARQRALMMRVSTLQKEVRQQQVCVV